MKVFLYLVSFAFCGALAVLGYENVMSELPNYIAYSHVNDCTFACGSQMVQGFWSVAAITVLFASAAVVSLVGFIFAFGE